MSTPLPVPRAEARPARQKSPETLEWVVAPEEKPVEFNPLVAIAWELQILFVIGWTLLCLEVAEWFDSYWGFNLVGALWVAVPLELYRRGREHDRRTRIKPSPFYFWF